MRVEQIGGATLYLADYRDVELPTSLDAVFTDPPYGKTACNWDSEPADMAAFWKKITPAIKDNAAVVVFWSRDVLCGRGGRQPEMVPL